ncbi:hypothetical protein E2C01_033205 [Portunus trituberculatus]|uniref:Uncharacterized protein n=1 Tax=Portunus trituberculatus TaxID=210409 RepID=A0A5B7EX93_PORTR|nr:hypothetical protein [Portunus trituberculatus]
MALSYTNLSVEMCPNTEGVERPEMICLALLVWAAPVLLGESVSDPRGAGGRTEVFGHVLVWAWTAQGVGGCYVRRAAGGTTQHHQHIITSASQHHLVWVTVEQRWVRCVKCTTAS